MARGRGIALALAGLAGAGWGCRPIEAGLGLEGGVLPAPPPDVVVDAAPPHARFDAYRLPDRDSPDLDEAPPSGVSGPPAEIGCADGTREGFMDATAWVNIAGCSGGWSIPGLLSARSRESLCGRAAGNTGARATGDGCTVADLCADGWRVCENADDVAQSSPTGCESAVPAGHAALFVVRAGASPLGLCGPEAVASQPEDSASNDLHGCGSWGRPEHAQCAPLSRRLSFSDCGASAGVWMCGHPEQHLEEARLVIKTDVALGGVLCCRNR